MWQCEPQALIGSDIAAVAGTAPAKGARTVQMRARVGLT